MAISSLVSAISQRKQISREVQRSEKIAKAIEDVEPRIASFLRVGGTLNEAVALKEAQPSRFGVRSEQFTREVGQESPLKAFIARAGGDIGGIIGGPVGAGLGRTATTLAAIGAERRADLESELKGLLRNFAPPWETERSKIPAKDLSWGDILTEPSFAFEAEAEASPRWENLIKQGGALAMLGMAAKQGIKSLINTYKIYKPQIQSELAAGKFRVQKAVGMKPPTALKILSDKELRAALKRGDISLAQAMRQSPIVKEEAAAIRRVPETTVPRFGQPPGGMVKFGDTALSPIETPKIDLLAEEAKKHKTVKTFRDSLPKVFRGTGKDSGTFRTKGIGVHFGTKEQAEFVARAKGGEEGVVKEVVLDMKNPIRLEDRNAWGHYGILQQLRGLDIVSEKEFINLVYGKASEDFDVRELLRKKGYDGIVYFNRAEGEGDSFLTFSNDQIKTKQQLTDIWKQVQGKKGR